MMNNTYNDEEDTEQGQGSPLVLSLSDSDSDSDNHEQEMGTRMAPQKGEKLQGGSPYNKYGVLAAFLLVAVVALSSTLPSQFHSSPQNHRRLVVDEEQRHNHKERELSIASRVFNVISAFTQPEDLGFGISADTDGAEDEGQCPGQDRYKGLYMEVPSIWTADLGMFGIEDLKGADEVQRTFMVEPNHTVLEGGRGVQFNVEVVPEARPEDGNMMRLSEEDILSVLREEAAEFYGLDVKEVKPTATSKRNDDLKNEANQTDEEADPLVEVMSRMPADADDGSGTVFASGQGFLAACMTAFACKSKKNVLTVGL